MPSVYVPLRKLIAEYISKIVLSMKGSDQKISLSKFIIDVEERFGAKPSFTKEMLQRREDANIIEIKGDEISCL